MPSPSSRLRVQEVQRTKKGMFSLIACFDTCCLPLDSKYARQNKFIPASSPHTTHPPPPTTTTAGSMTDDRSPESSLYKLASEWKGEEDIEWVAIGHPPPRSKVLKADELTPGEIAGLRVRPGTPFCVNHKEITSTGEWLEAGASTHDGCLVTRFYSEDDEVNEAIATEELGFVSVRMNILEGGGREYHELSACETPRKHGTRILGWVPRSEYPSNRVLGAGISFHDGLNVPTTAARTATPGGTRRRAFSQDQLGKGGFVQPTPFRTYSSSSSSASLGRSVVASHQASFTGRPPPIPFNPYRVVGYYDM